MSVITATNPFVMLAPVRLYSGTNLAGTYFNGATGNGVGATLTASTAAALTIDSVTANVNDRVLLNGQTSASQNGIWVVVNPGSASVSWILQRAGDFQCIEQMTTGAFTTVKGGTVDAGSIWVLVEPLPATVGVSNITFASGLAAGLGTAASKAATNNADASVVSFTGTTSVINDLPTFADTTGSIQDSGFSFPTTDALVVNAPLVSNGAKGLSFNNGAIVSAAVTLTAAQVLTMSATPVQIIPAPGAGKAIMVTSLQLYLNHVTTAFAGGGVGVLQYAATATGAGTNSLTGTIPAANITAAASQIINFMGSVTALTGITNQGIFLSNQTGAFTGGGASTLTCYVQYQVVTATV